MSVTEATCCTRVNTSAYKLCTVGSEQMYPWSGRIPVVPGVGVSLSTVTGGPAPRLVMPLHVRHVGHSETSVLVAKSLI